MVVTSRRRAWAAGLLGALLGACGTPATVQRPAQDDAPIPGFAPASVAAQRAREAAFAAVPSARSARENVRRLARAPHLAGTEGARAVGRLLADEMRRLGFDVTVERYDAYLPQPVHARLLLLEPERRELRVRERLPDAPASDTSALFLAWNAYSANDRIEAPVVYANYGLPADYRALERMGVPVRGRIVVARYGRAFRGVKVEQAERRGAVGLVLYSDPADDGFARGDTLPVGPFRPADAVQRGTVKYLWRYTGDPLTPGRPARPGVPRLDPAEAADLPGIPVLPVGYGQAAHLLRSMSGRPAPEAFRGGLDLTYRVGDGSTRLRLEVEQRRATRPVRNVIARLPGRTEQEIILGNHYDAWLYGGIDAHSGTAAVLETARGLAALRRTGWTPRRGITIAFWDAEEYGVIGSTEWVEDHVERLRSEAVAYFNVDVFTAGTLDVSGSHSLRDLVISAADAVVDPRTGRSLGDAWRERRRSAATQEEGAGAAAASSEPELGVIGAGSDWTAFLHFAGVPSLQWTMNGRGTYAVYHSAWDDFDYYRLHADPGFEYTPLFARAMGIAALRLADADALPFRYTDYAGRIEDHLRAFERRARDAGVTGLGPSLARVRAELERLRVAAEGVERAQRHALAAGDAGTMRAIDRALPTVERAFLDPAGQPGRPWYRHRIYAPGRSTGYASLPLPGPAEALADRDATAVRDALDRLADALGRAADRLAAGAT